jgi:alpha-D-xyloside xylohydrolase
VVGGPDPSYFAVGDSLGTGVSQDLDDGRPVATETFGIGPGDAVYGFGETFLGLDKTGQTLDLSVADAVEFAPDRFPDPEGFCRALAADGVHFVRGYQGPVHVVDWTNPEAVRVMTEEYGRLLGTGASVVKVDFGEELPDEAVYADGTPAERMRNLYPLRYQEAVHAATAAARGEDERIAWSRSGWAGAQRFLVHWGGDVPPAWEMMLPQLHGGLSLGLSGFSFWSADIGGTGEPPADHELLIRWLQWAVLLSHPRVHGMGVREPCRWPEPARRVAGDWIRLRYRLLPYVLAEAGWAAGRGLPFARPLVLEFPDDPATWRIGDQFLCGRSILAAPLFEPGGRRRPTRPPGPGPTGGPGNG